MAGKAIYFTELELEMIRFAFDEGNASFDGFEDEEKRYEAAANIVRKVSE